MLNRRYRDDMTDDKILAGWRQTRQDHAIATGMEYGPALSRKLSAERAAIERFGRGAHLQAYRARYGEGAER